MNFFCQFWNKKCLSYFLNKSFFFFMYTPCSMHLQEPYIKSPQGGAISPDMLLQKGLSFNSHPLIDKQGSCTSLFPPNRLLECHTDHWLRSRTQTNVSEKRIIRCCASEVLPVMVVSGDLRELKWLCDARHAANLLSLPKPSSWTRLHDQSCSLWIICIKAPTVVACLEAAVLPLEMIRLQQPRWHLRSGLCLSPAALGRSRASWS